MTFRQPAPATSVLGPGRDADGVSADPFPLLADLPLARGAVDRGCERRADEAWLPGLLESPATRALVLVGGRAPVVDGALALTGPAELPPAENLVYLGRVDGTEVVLADLAEVPGGFAEGVDWLGLRDVAAGLSARDAGLFVEAVAIANWHATHRHCPRCGAATETVQSGWVRRCPADGSLHFPRTDPAIIVAITDAQDRLLLGANAQWGGSRFSTLAGFVEPGESLEAAVVREVAEESGVAVHSPRYAGSQPWPFPASLMLGFTAVADATDTVPDGHEIVDLRWFTRDQLAREVRDGTITVPAGVSIARALVEQWYGAPLPEPRQLEN
ncbi:NAD(+) diphosphatase [Arthrobacter halodurans]|jgi:NAD+ diphosphatase|uniref:NAD(+) diphosphatase n=1 Tax=Arthrobacter halodurans TaxID=516699 RepID=A0ABV4UQS1_9MICC